MKLPEFSVKRPVTALMLFLGIILVGAFCMVQMPIDLFPEMDIPAITVLTSYEGAGPEEVEEKITQPLEERLATVEDIDHIVSTSREGMSIIRLSFSWETDIDNRANDVRDAIDLAQEQIPEEADRSRIFKLDVGQFPILVYGVFAGESYENLEDILEDQVANPLESISGVGAVRVIIPLNRQVNVDLDRERLASYNLTPADVVRAVARENRETSAGSIKMGDTDYLPRVPGEFKSTGPMNDIVVTARDGAIVRIKDLGRVSDAFKEIERYITVNGKPGAILLVHKQSEANTVAVARAVEKSLKKLRERLPSDVRVVNIMDSSEDIRQMVRDLAWTLLIGGGLAMLAVFVFLRQTRGTFIIGLTIPFSLIAAGTIMYFCDYSINMMTLFALIVAIGMVVDNSIVVLENIARHREEGESASEGAIYGASEVGMAIVASTLTTLCIFFPLLFVRGVTKILFTPFAVVATAVILASLFTALSMTPMLASRLLARSYGGGKEGNYLYRLTEAGFNRIASAYASLLEWCLRRRGLVLTAVMAIFVGTLALLPAIGWEFMAKEDRALVQGTVELPVGTRVERTAEVMQVINRVIREELPEEHVRAIFTRCGTSTSGFSTDEGAHIGHFGVALVRRGQRDRHVVEIANDLRKRIQELVGLYSIETFRIDLMDPMSNLILGGEQPLSINVLGDNFEETDRIAVALKSKVEKIPGTVDISISREKGAPELWVNVDRQKASSMGLNVSDVADTVRTSVYGRVASKYRVRGDEYDIFVRLREADRRRPEDLGQVPLRLPSGRLVRVENVSDVVRERGPVEIERKDQQRIVRVEGDALGRSLGEVVADVKDTIREMDIPPGVSVVVSGQSEEMGEAFLWLSIALVVGIVLVYMIMASQFESLVDPFVVMFSVPFAFIGVVWALFLGGYSLNIIVFLGLLLLIGIVVNNAIVLVDYINILRARGKSMTDAVCEAGRTRLRPVLMTAFTTILALAPMAFRGGQASEIWNPLGATIIGGLLVSTLVTLVLVPTIYSIFESRVERTNNR